MPSDVLPLANREGLPEGLRALLAQFPRDDWRAHPHFAGLVAFWLERHMLFRQLLERLQRDAEAAVDGAIAPDSHAVRLSRYGSMLVSQLHGHHQIEDHQYFPILSRAEPGLLRGFDILDRDHHALDGLLTRFADSANAVLQGQGEAGVFHAELLAFERMLHRHLEDEEDLIVPVILKHGADNLTSI